MDGGMNDETLFLRGFIAALGNEVEAWFTSHPHNDHVGALTKILQKPDGMKINKVYHSRFCSPARPPINNMRWTITKRWTNRASRWRTRPNRG